MFEKFDPELRIALMQAASESREMGHRTIGPEHLLLGLLTNVRGSAYRLLTAHGMQFDSAREALLAAHADEPEPDDTADDASSSLDDDREALRAIGIDLDKVRDAVKGAFGDDITRDWGERRTGHGRGRGRGGPHGHRGGRRGGPGGPPWGGPDSPWGERPFEDFGEERGPHGGGRGRRGPRSRRFGPGRLSPGMHGVFEQMRDAARQGLPFDGAQLLLALMNAGDPVVEAMLSGCDDVDALRADVERQAASPKAG